MSETERIGENGVTITGGVKFAIYTIAICMSFMIAYFARALLLPVVLSIVLTLTLSPLVRFARRRNVPTWISAAALTGMLFVGLSAGMFAISQPLTEWIEDAPYIGYRLKQRIENIREPMEAVPRAEKEVEEITEPREPGVQKVVIDQPGLLTRAAGNLATILGTIVVTFGLMTFLLAYSDVFYTKLMRILPTLSDRKRALRIIHDTERDVSRYLLTITVINIALGILIGAAMWLLNMPTPYLWGIAATLLNFLPFIGAIAGTVLVSVIALISIDSFAAAAAVPLVYMVLTALEGYYVTPALLGRSLKLNPVVILLSIALWGFLWGIVGVLIAVPILIIVKVFCDQIDGASAIAEFLSG